MKMFEQGKKYFGRFVSNYDHIVIVEITKRTPRTVVCHEKATGETYRRKVNARNGYETIQACSGVTITSKNEIE